MRMRDWVILSGNANRPLAQKICEKLGKNLGHADVRRFSDGEAFVEIRENVRGRDAAVVPNYAYACQDLKVAPRTPISAKLVADLFVAAGATRVVSMDLHAGQIQ